VAYRDAFGGAVTRDTRQNVVLAGRSIGTGDDLPLNSRAGDTTRDKRAGKRETHHDPGYNDARTDALVEGPPLRIFPTNAQRILAHVIP
jgi:hypothetical protein